MEQLKTFNQQNYYVYADIRCGLIPYLTQ